VVLNRPASSLDSQVLVDPSCSFLSYRKIVDRTDADEEGEEYESEGVGGEVLRLLEGLGVSRGETASLSPLFEEVGERKETMGRESSVAGDEESVVVSREIVDVDINGDRMGRRVVDGAYWR